LRVLVVILLEILDMRSRHLLAGLGMEDGNRGQTVVGARRILTPLVVVEVVVVEDAKVAEEVREIHVLTLVINTILKG
jgi:hypothetical protein